MRAHNIEHEIWLRTAQQATGFKRFYLANLAKRIKNLEVKLINKYDYLVPITSRDEKVFTALGNTKPSSALPTGILAGDMKPDIAVQDKLRVAHLGALDWYPNQEGILWFLNDVWPLVLEKIPDASFHLAGRNAPDWFIKKIDVPGVKYHGEVNSADDFIRHFPIHVVPLWSGSGMRIKIIETMAKGRVIVTTPIGIEGIEAINNKSVAIRESAESFASVLLELNANSALVKEISQNAFTFVKSHFDNVKLVKDFLSFLNEHANSI